MTFTLRQQEEGEPLLPVATTVDMNLADEKAVNNVHFKEDGIAPPAYHLTPSSSNNKKWDYLKKFLIAIALMMMGASTMKLCQKYSHRHRRHHHHHNFKKIDYLSSSPLRQGLTRPHANHLPPFMHPPGPEECFALKDEESVHFNLTVSGFIHSVFLDPSLKNAKVDIESMPTRENSSEIEQPKVGAGFIGKYHEGRSKPGCTRKKSTIFVTAKSISEKKSIVEGEKEIYICSLDLPFGQMGIGLFHGKPTKDKDVQVKHDRPKAPESFDPVSIQLRFPPGPYTVTSQPPLPHHFGHRPPPPPVHKGHGPHPHPHHPKGPHHDHHHKPMKGIKIGCLKKKLRIMWKGLLPGQSGKHGAPRKQIMNVTKFILP